MAMATGLVTQLCPAVTAPAQAAPAAAKPGAPLIDSVFPRDGAVEVNVKVGRHQTKINKMEVTATPGGRTATLDNPRGVSTLLVDGLTNGQQYRFTAVEISAGVRSDSSAPSVRIAPEPARRPRAPTIAAVYPRDRALLARWNPAPDAGAPVTGYTVVARPGKLGDPTKPATGDVTVTTDGNTGATTVPNLTNGTKYAVFVRATNKVGIGVPGAADKSTAGTTDGLVAPRPPYAPGPAVHVAATAPVTGDHRVLVVTWDPPADDGGAPVTGYKVTATPGGATVTVGANARSARLTGLDPATVYKVTVTPHNSAAAERLNASEPVAAAPGSQVSGNSVLLSAESLSSISVLQSNRIVFTNPPQQVRDLAQGKVILASTPSAKAPYGFARKVTTVTIDAATVAVTTINVDLAEAMNARFTAAVTNDSMRAARIAAMVPGLRAEGSFGDTLNISLEYVPNEGDPDVGKDPTVEVGFRGSLTGQLSVDVNWSADVGISGFEGWPWDWDIKPWADFTATATAKASLDGEIGTYFKASKEIKDFLEIRPGCVAVYVVLLCPVITASAIFEAEGSLSFTFTAKYEKTIGGRLTFNVDGDDWNHTDLSTPEVKEFTHSLEANATLTIGLPVQVSILVFDVAGPELTFTPSLVFSVEPTADPWGTIDLKLDAALGFTLDVLFWSVEYEWPIPIATIELWHSEGPFPGLSMSGTEAAPDGTERTAAGRKTKATFDLPDGGSVYLSTRKSACGPNRPLTWSLNSGASGTVKPTGSATATYTSPATPGHYTEVVTVTQPATKACKVTRSKAVIHTGTSTPGQPRNVTAKSDGKTTKITWRPPADTGASPISRYRVIVWNDKLSPAQVSPYVLGETTGTTMAITDPDTVDALSQPGVGFTVVAFNTSGAGSKSDRYVNPKP